MTVSKSCFVLIRGILREARHWGKLPGLIQKHYPSVLILTPDIPGNGRLSHITSPNNIADMTDAIRVQVPNDYPLKLIAISMGGMVAIDWMIRYPDEVESAILINTSLKNISPFYQRLRWQKYPEVMQLIFSAKRQREQLILALTSNKHAHDSDIIKDWLQWQHENPVTAKSAINQFIASARFSINSAPVQPLLIMCSLADRLVDYRCSLKIQQHWHKDYKQHSTAGHDLPLDDPHWFMTEMSHWFNQH